MNEKLIKQLREGTIALKNDGTLEDLKKVLWYAFPEDKTNSEGTFKYYYKRPYYNEWGCSDIINALTHSVKEFLKPESEYPKVMKVSMFPIKTKEQFENARTRVVFMKKNDRFIAWTDAKTIEKSEYEVATYPWSYAVDLNWQPEEEIKPLKLTMEQIAEKFNAEKIEIVNYGK